MTLSMNRRISALEGRDSGHGVVAVLRYEDENEGQARAAHLAAGGADPSTAEITVMISHPGKRPDEPAASVVTRRDAAESNLARIIAERRQRVARLNGDD